MKLQSSLSSILAIISLFFAGCGNSRLAAVHTITMDGNVAKPKKFEYRSQASDNASAVGYLALGLPGALIGRTVRIGPRKEIENMLAAKGIVVEKVASAAFADEMARSGLFTVLPQGGADATIKLQIPVYLLVHKSGMFSNTLAPGVVIEGQFADASGRNFYSFDRDAFAAKEHWHSQAEYLATPELLRAGWDEAARTATREIIKRIRKKAGK